MTIANHSACLNAWTYTNKGILYGLACSVALHGGLLATASQFGDPMMSPKPSRTFELGTMVITVPKKHKASRVGES